MPEIARTNQKLVDMKLGVRTVTLCRGHALIAENSGVRTFEGLRELYGSGRRSYVPRRRSLEGLAESEHRLGRGRRASDLPVQGDFGRAEGPSPATSAARATAPTPRGRGAISR
jgi:hypothetical protein